MNDWVFGGMIEVIGGLIDLAARARMIGCSGRIGVIGGRDEGGRAGMK